MFNKQIEIDIMLITNKLVYEICENFIKKELNRIPNEIDRINSTIHRLCIFDLSTINNDENKRILTDLLTPTAMQQVPGRVKLLIRELYCRSGITLISECIKQVEYSLSKESTFPFKEYVKLKKKYSYIWILPYLQMVYNHIL